MDDPELEAIRAEKLAQLQGARKEGSAFVAPVHLTDETFGRMVQEGLVLVDFWAAWCAPCLRFAPTFEAMARDYEGRVKFGKLNVDENPQTSEAFGIQAIPTIILFKDGVPVEAVQGALPRPHLERFLDRWL